MVYLCDFDDSFTYNIYSELKTIGLEVTIVERNKVNNFLEGHVSTHKKLAIVLGPGPGHPKDYNSTVEIVKKLLARENMLIMGICLGHQIIANSLGMKVDKSTNPKHGEVEVLNLTKLQQKFLNTKLSSLEVQRYNSLAAKTDSNNLAILKNRNIEWIEYNSELCCLKSKNFISYQFHPESVGTSFRSLFFRPLKTFLL